MAKKVFTLQVDEEMLARWKESAAARSMSVAALIHEGMEAVLDADANDEIPIPPPIPAVPVGIPVGLARPRLGSTYEGGHPVGPILPPRVTGAAGDATGYRPKHSWRTTDK